MPFYMVRNDITLMETNAIVNAAKNSLLGGGGAHKCAGGHQQQAAYTAGRHGF